MRGRQRCGWTLIELVVVLAIIAIVSAILFTVIASSRDSGHKATETVRLRQIYVAINLYEEDFDRKSPPTLVDLAPQYVRLTYLENEQDPRASLRYADWPANPWTNFRGVDAPAIMRQRTTSRVAYAYLRVFEGRFQPGRTFESFRNEPAVGLVTGLGLMKCDNSLGNTSCRYPVNDPAIDLGQPASNLSGSLLTVRMDGSIAVRRRPSPVGGTPSYEQLFLFWPMGPARWQPVN